MNCIPIDRPSQEEWDAIISKFDTKALFHGSPWLEFLEKAQNGRAVFLEILEGSTCVGYFVGLIVKKGPFKILGSPLRGWTTQFMGPIIDSNFSQHRFLVALDEYCSKTGIDQLEFSSPRLEPTTVSKHGFECRRDVTPILDLRTDKETLWKILKPKSCRYEIRKALKNNVTVKDTDDPAVVDRYYNQLVMVFAKQGLIPTYPLNTVKALFESLRKREMLFCLEAKYKDRTIATGIFPHDNESIYYWGGASDPAYRGISPNELIQWTLIKMALEKGIKKYDMYGGDNPFKLKFGCELKEVLYWFKSFNKLAKFSRKIYEYRFNTRQKIFGAIANQFILKRNR